MLSGSKKQADLIAELSIRLDRFSSRFIDFPALSGFVRFVVQSLCLALLGRSQFVTCICS